MPIFGQWENPSLRRCDGKSAYSSKKAEKAARLASKRTGDLIVAYMCYHCGKWHIGHADKSQHIVRAETDRRGFLRCLKIAPTAVSQSRKRDDTPLGSLGQILFIALRTAKK